MLVKLAKGGAVDADSEARLLTSLLLSPGRQRQLDTLALPRKKRLEIAAAVSWAALYLCGTPWLGSEWNGKDDVRVFLERQGQANCASVMPAQPGILHIFWAEVPPEHMSPPDDAARFQTCQIRNKAIFTLGILLVELCFSKTFEQLCREAQENEFTLLSQLPHIGSVTPPPPDEYEIATGLIDKIFLREGDLYGDATRTCLRCEFPGRDVMKDFSFPSFLKHFFDGVVAPVQATFESCI